MVYCWLLAAIPRYLSVLPPMLLSSLSWSSLRFPVCLSTIFFDGILTCPIDIERIYRKCQPIAVRKPLVLTDPRKWNTGPLPAPHKDCTDGLPTPPATEGKTVLGTEVKTNKRTRELNKTFCTPSVSHESPKKIVVQQQPVSEHDLYHKYFRHDVVGLLNIDLLQ